MSNEPPSVGAASGVTKTRVGSHDGYDRAVIELTGGDSAGLWWRAEYDPEPATQGQGAAVDLPGSATLRLILRGQTTPPPSPVVSGEQPGGSAGQITAVYVDPVFEGQSVVFIGVEQQVPFRVFTLDSPTRVVVDFQS